MRERERPCKGLDGIYLEQDRESAEENAEEERQERGRGRGRGREGVCVIENGRERERECARERKLVKV